MTTAAAYLAEHVDDMVADLERFVARETPSEDKAALDAFAAFLADHARSIDGARAEVLAQRERGDHVRVTWGDPGSEAPALLIGHFDTVWPVGTLARQPFRVVDGAAYGPGSFDMKGGLVQGLWAVRAYHAAGGRRPIVLLANSDEEIGSPSSRSLIEDEARRSALALVLEPALDEGKLKSARRGLARYRIDVHGRSSHSGLAPDAGISAVDELCRLALALKGLEDRAAGTRVNIGVIGGGTRYNVVAAHAWCDVDVRIVTAAELARVDAAVRALVPVHPEARVEVSGGTLWPPMERNERIGALADHAKRLAHDLGFAVDEGRSGGSSDGCHCAAVGAAVLDGLGPVGDGAHAVHEHVRVAEMPRRAALVARLLETVDAAGRPVEGGAA